MLSKEREKMKQSNWSYDNMIRGASVGTKRKNNAKVFFPGSKTLDPISGYTIGKIRTLGGIQVGEAKKNGLKVRVRRVMGLDNTWIVE
jgi:hypothetical protein